MNRKNRTMLKTFGVSVFIALFLCSTVSAQLTGVHSLRRGKCHYHSRWMPSEFQEIAASANINTLRNVFIPSEKERQSVKYADHLNDQSERRTRQQKHRVTFKILRGLEFHIRNIAQTNRSREERSSSQQSLITVFLPTFSAYLLNGCLLPLTIVPSSTPQRLYSLQVLRL